MAPVTSSDISTGNIKNCVVILCDIFSGSRLRKQRDGQKMVHIDESSSDEEVPAVMKKRIVKIISDEEEDKENSYFGRAEDSNYESESNSYEKMIEKKRAEKIALLKYVEIDKIKEEISDAVDSINQIKKIRPYKKQVFPSEPTRRSKRLANTLSSKQACHTYNSSKMSQSFSPESEIYTSDGRALRSQAMHPQLYHWFSQPDYNVSIPSKITFKVALKSERTYKECVHDLSIQKPKFNQEFISYNKSVLKNMSLPESNVCKVVPTKITSAAWYPSKEDLVVAAGDEYGNLGLWKIQDSETTPHLFKVHSSNIPNMQFCSFNPVHLITASYDGTMRCGDLIKRTFNEIYVSDTSRVTWFDFISPSTLLSSHSTGEIALFDRRTGRNTNEIRHKCHDITIKTVSVHPINKNVFITADNRKNIRLWDIRKLQKMPIFEILHHTKSVNSAYFSPVTGNSILTTSMDGSICIFDSTNLTQDINLKTKMRHNNFTGLSHFILRATWLPNSDDMFSICSLEQPRGIEIYDKDLNLYLNMMNDNLTTITFVQRFHPFRNALAAGNTAGKLYVFT